MIHIYCGDGKGKTTASCGLALRAAGSGMRVLYTSFFKSGDSSEVEALASVKNITYLKPEKFFGRYKTLDEKEKTESALYYNSLFEKAAGMSESWDMLVLDEAISSYNYGAIDRSRLMEFLSASGKEKEIVLTGRGPASELVDIADYVTEMRKVKHPFDAGITARPGIEY